MMILIGQKNQIHRYLNHKKTKEEKGMKKIDQAEEDQDLDQDQEYTRSQKCFIKLQ